MGVEQVRSAHALDCHAAWQVTEACCERSGAMMKALDLHDRIIRASLHQYWGYEVRRSCLRAPATWLVEHLTPRVLPHRCTPRAMRSCWPSTAL